MTEQHEAGPSEGTGANGLWVPPSAQGRTFEFETFDPDRNPSFRMTEVGDIQFTTDYVIVFGLNGNIRAFHHTEIRRVIEMTDRTPVPTGARPSRVEL